MTLSLLSPSVRQTVLAAAIVSAVALPWPALHAAAAAPPGSPTRTLLAVPYLAQTELLCGGAALSMVLRYWGAGDVVPEDFAHLVDESAGGISTTRLTAAATERGWIALPTYAGGDDPLGLVDRHVGQARPVLALIEDRPGVFHYVVVVGVTAAVVVLHDPAREPYRVMPRAEFLDRWDASTRWMMIVLPSPVRPAAERRLTAPAADMTEPPLSPNEPCAELVGRSVAAARDGRAGEAERGLTSATELCAAQPSGWRELAGLRLVQRRFLESAGYATTAVRLDPADAHAWQLLATSRFAMGDLPGALRAWNAVGQPRLDSVSVEGLRRTHQPIAMKLIGLRSRQLLTENAFVRTARRLEELPAGARSSVRYTPIDDGVVRVNAYVDERRALPSGIMGWSVAAARMLIAKEIRLDVAALAHQGELWTAAYRWPGERPRGLFRLALPAPGSLPGIVHVELFREHQTYARPLTGEPGAVESRQRAGVNLSDWANGWLRWQVGAATDHLGEGDYVALNGAGSSRLFGDHLLVTAEIERWISTSPRTAGFTSVEIGAGWRSTTDTDAPAWTMDAGLVRASADAPLAVWPGASSQRERGILLRAHPLLGGHVVTGEVFGRKLAFGSLQHQRPVWRSPYGSLAIAGFVDGARAWRRLDSDRPSPLHIDVGGGIRINTPAADGEVRLDLAVGVQDGRTRLSAGYVTRWGTH